MKRVRWLDLIFVLIAFVFYFRAPFDPDLGWELRCGQMWWQGMGFCAVNQFTALLSHFKWVNHAWLYQVFLELIYSHAGVLGLSILGGVVAGLTVSLIYFSMNTPRWWRLIWIALFVWVTRGVFSLGIRSQLFGLLIFSGQLLAWRRIKRRPLAIGIWILLMWLWVNFHGSFVIGLVAGVFLFGEEMVRTRRRSLIWGWLAGAAVTILNPFGVEVFREAWSHFHGVKLGQMIAEWVAPSGLVWWLSVGCGVMTIVYLLVSKRGKRAWLGGGVFLFLMLALSAQRHVPFLWIWSGYWLFENGSIWLTLNKRISIADQKTLAWFLLLVFAICVLVLKLPAEIKTVRNYEAIICSTYPCKAVEFLKQAGDTGAIFNRYEWGGYLVWKMPDRQFFVDGRMPAWSLAGKSPYTIYLEALQNLPGWQKVLADYGMEWILISPDTFMDLLLSPAPAKYGWQEVYRDKISVVYLQI